MFNYKLEFFLMLESFLQVDKEDDRVIPSKNLDTDQCVIQGVPILWKFLIYFKIT